jgi:hypothetical protein
MLADPDPMRPEAKSDSPKNFSSKNSGRKESGVRVFRAGDERIPKN